jgi:RimJ/RimL family protein N-acetyltransferase
MPWIELDPASPSYPFDQEVELGYASGQEHWRRRYATEACRAIVRYAFTTLGLRRRVNSVRRENERSVRLLQRVGFRLEANLADPPSLVGVLDHPMRPGAPDSGAG